jgi:hypothetical protein
MTYNHNGVKNIIVIYLYIPIIIVAISDLLRVLGQLHGLYKQDGQQGE